MVVRRRFIAGTRCPTCQAQDSLVMWCRNNVDAVKCIKCGHQMHEADKEVHEYACKEEQVIGIFHPDQRYPLAFFKLEGTRLQNSATIRVTILPISGDIMEVVKDLVVSLAYQVRTEDGVLVDESPVSVPLDHLYGHGSLISGLENALDGHEVGDKFDVAVGANDAYGQYDENLVQCVLKDAFMGADELQVGVRFLAKADQDPVSVEITEIGDDHVVADGSHMLASQNLKPNVEAVAIREATAKELEHGYAHGTHGHDHDHDHGYDGCCGGHGHGHGYDHEHGKGGCDNGDCDCH